jgi:hypothetical protein
MPSKMDWKFGVRILEVNPTWARGEKGGRSLWAEYLLSIGQGFA